VIPTPGIAFLASELGAAGVVISASHNPAAYNGIKLFGSSGYKLPDPMEDEIEALLGSAPAAGEPGRVNELPDAAERYLHHLTDHDDRLDGLRVVLDCANGAACELGPEAYRRLGADVQVIHDEPDGENINEGCGVMHADVVTAETARRGVDAGIAHDGDADRALFSDEAGRLVDGDQVIAACALDLKARGELERNVVVTTVMANLGFHRAMEAAGIEVRSTAVGDRYVLEEMLRSGAVLGGEQSGHIIFSDRATTGDGLLTAIRFLSLAARNGRRVSELAASMRRFPQVLRNVPVSGTAGLEGADPVWVAVRAAERALGASGRVLVRASGTEPLVRVMIEAETEELAEEHAETICRRVEETLGPSRTAG
jgi:phosphoglucosamine mutase